MSDRLEKIETKVDKIDERLDHIALILERQVLVSAQNTDSLKEHMRRTDLLEKKLEPVEEHVTHITSAIKGIFWFIGVVGTVLVTLKQLGML